MKPVTAARAWQRCRRGLRALRKAALRQPSPLGYGARPHEETTDRVQGRRAHPHSDSLKIPCGPSARADAGRFVRRFGTQVAGCGAGRRGGRSAPAACVSAEDSRSFEEHHTPHVTNRIENMA
jgi:hypothetical protein